MPRLPVDVYKPCVFNGPMSPQGIQSFAVGDGGFRERNNLEVSGLKMLLGKQRKTVRPL